MLSRLLAACSICICLASHATAGEQIDPTHSKTKNTTKLADLVSQGDGSYTKIADGVWQTAYKGKNLPVINVRIATGEGGVFFFIDLFDRKSIPLTRNLLLKITELNSAYDYVKLALSENSLHIRVDIHLRVLDIDEFKAIENQAALAADEAYAVLRDFVQ